MPIKLTELASDQRTCVVQWDGEEAEVTYRPSAYTPETETAFRDAMESNRPGNGFAGLLSKVLVSWDVLDDEGVQLPTTIEWLRRVPTAFLLEISNAISEDLRAEREDRKNSGGSSRRGARKGISQSGTRSSEPQSTLG